MDPLTARMNWLATRDRKQAAWSLSLERMATGRKRSGNRAEDAGWGAPAGRAFALTHGDTWGGIDFLAADAMVAEYQPLDRLAWLKDSADERTPGVHPWDESGAGTQDGQPNIRRAKPLEGAVLRGAAVGPGFHREHVLFLNRAHLIAHHRPDDPPINSTEISDPGTGDGDWTAGLHSLTRVRPWVNEWCGATTAGDEPFSALLNFTKSAGDFTGWGGAHFAEGESVLSAEAFGPLRHGAPKHRNAFTSIADIRRAAIDIDRAVFGDGTDTWSAPKEHTRAAWRPGVKGPYVIRVEERMDFNARHSHTCGERDGMWKRLGWVPFREYGPPPDRPPEKPPEEPPGEPRYPTMLVPPESPRPSVTTPDEIEAPSMYGHPVPNGPDAPGTSDWPEGGYSNDGPSYATFAAEIDALWMDRYKFTERQFNQQPLTGHGIWHAQYENATPAEGKHERWRPVKSRLEQLSVDEDGWVTGRTAALGHGGIMFAPADVLLHELYTTINPISDAPRNAFSLSVFSAAHSGGLQVADGEIGLGSLKPDKSGVVKGWRFRLDFSRLADADNPDLHLDQIDDEGAEVSTGKFYVNGVELGAGGSGDISSGSNLTSGRVVKATDVKQIDTPVDLSLAYITADSPGDTAQLLAGPGKRIEIRSPSRVTIDVNGTDEFAVDAGKVTVAGTIELGHASDTTLARLSAGDLSVEGNRIYRAGGTDVPVADGGTGASTAAGAIYNLLNGAADVEPALTDTVGHTATGTGGRISIEKLLALTGLVFEARLSPSSTLAVPTADASSVSTLYLHPYKGNRIALYDGTSKWKIYHMGAAVSKALSGLTANRPYDVFVYDNAGTLTLDYTAWSSATARATALTTVNGVYVKSGATHRRYVGTFYATGTTTTAWVTDGSTSTSAKLFIWNYYNRVNVTGRTREGTTSWTYSTATWRAMNNDTANRVEVVIGLREDFVDVQSTVVLGLNNSTGSHAIGEDSTSSPATSCLYPGAFSIDSCLPPGSAILRTQTAIGYHYYQALEIATLNTVTFYGSHTAPYTRNGITLLGRF